MGINKILLEIGRKVSQSDFDADFYSMALLDKIIAFEDSDYKNELLLSTCKQLVECYLVEYLKCGKDDYTRVMRVMSQKRFLGYYEVLSGLLIGASDDYKIRIEDKKILDVININVGEFPEPLKMLFDALKEDKQKRVFAPLPKVPEDTERIIKSLFLALKQVQTAKRYNKPVEYRIIDECVSFDNFKYAFGLREKQPFSFEPIKTHFVNQQQAHILFFDYLYKNFKFDTISKEKFKSLVKGLFLDKSGKPLKLGNPNKGNKNDGGMYHDNDKLPKEIKDLFVRKK